MDLLQESFALVFDLSLCPTPRKKSRRRRELLRGGYVSSRLALPQLFVTLLLLSLKIDLRPPDARAL